ncbi:MAG: CvpA family protein [Campylobacterota bacterium]|nr:CvpA family protein [Campylobacterota bacterium]
MDINYFDIAVGAVVLLLGLKGIINGFFKEMFGLIGIIGGLFIASRYGEPVGQQISDLIFHFENSAAVNFTGFLATLAAFWIVMILLGSLFKKLGSASGLGIIDRIFGFIVGSGKFFLIGAVIVYAMNNIDALKSKLDPIMQNSILYPIMVEVGGYVMHIDPTEVSKDLAEKIETSTTAVGQATKEIVADTVKQNIDSMTTKKGE